jgi:LuxR family maltose regulon positive regulatory protein
VTVPAARAGRATKRAPEAELAFAAEDPWVVRDRLLAHVMGPTATPVVVISGPAGAGKSTLARQWADHDRRTVATVRLASHLDEPAGLATALLGALEAIGPKAPQTRAAITGNEPSFSAVLLPALTELASSRRRPYLLVVDDVHLVREASAQAVLAAVCSGVPAGSAVALLTRDATPPWLARTRAEARLLEVRPDDLVFDLDEARALFARLGASDASDTVAVAVARSEGWAVGLYLAALAERQGRVEGRAVADFRRFVGDYLQVEVIDQLGPDAQAFMLGTSVLDELTPAACNAVTGRHDAAHQLEQLNRSIQLVVQTAPGTYRYHHLLAECLQERATTLDADGVSEAHRRAAGWYGDHDDLDAAIRHAKAAGDLAMAGRLVWSGIVETIGSSRPDRLHMWLADLDDRQIGEDRWLTLAAAWSGLQGSDLPRATRWLRTAEAVAGPDWRDRMTTDPYAAQIAVPHALIGSAGLAETDVVCARALQGLPPDEPMRAPLLFLRGVALVLQRDLDGGLASLRLAEAHARSFDVPLIVADSLAFQGMVAMIAGDRERASALISGGTEMIKAHHLERLATAAHTMTAQALMLAIKHEDAEARATLAQARRMTVAVNGMTEWFHVIAPLIQARTSILLGDGAMARVLVTEARAAMTPELSLSLAHDILVDTEASLQTMTAPVAGAKALTSAELRVLAFLPSHLSFPQIGEHLFLSQNTVKTHALSIYRKFGVTSRAEAVTTAQQLGLVEPPARD